mmetsp:Transcript_53727/g.122187  ORF Transcript_53727/g.122187 Transcript_53727/m.122187 type:complete len:375 (+) Transcript_53727:246-1370(+)
MGTRYRRHAGSTTTAQRTARINLVTRGLGVGEATATTAPSKHRSQPNPMMMPTWSTKWRIISEVISTLSFDCSALSPSLASRASALTLSWILSSTQIKAQQNPESTNAHSKFRIVSSSTVRRPAMAHLAPKRIAHAEACEMVVQKSSLTRSHSIRGTLATSMVDAFLSRVKTPSTDMVTRRASPLGFSFFFTDRSPRKYIVSTSDPALPKRIKSTGSYQLWWNNVATASSPSSLGSVPDTAKRRDWTHRKDTHREKTSFSDSCTASSHISSNSSMSLSRWISWWRITRVILFMKAQKHSASTADPSDAKGEAENRCCCCKCPNRLIQANPEMCANRTPAEDRFTSVVSWCWWTNSCFLRVSSSSNWWASRAVTN